MENLIKWFKDNNFNSVVSGYETLTQELGIEVKHYEDEQLFVFNYCQIESPKTNPIVMESRGLILDDEFNAVCRPFNRFFNHGEALEITSNFDIQDSVVYEKVDGSLCKVYWWDNCWRVATRGTAFAEFENYTGVKFADLIIKAFNCSCINELNTKLDNALHRDFTYVFEYISPDNRVVTPYVKDEMVLLGSRHNKSGIEIKDVFSVRDRLVAQGLNVRTPKMYSFTSDSEMKEFVNSLSDLNEGVVAHDIVSGIRIKMKSDTYVAVHKLRGDCLPTPKKIMNLVVTNETDEYLNYFPEETERFKPYKDSWELLKQELTRVYDECSIITDQKEFALKVKDFPYQWVLFMARKSNHNPVKVLNNLDVNKKVKLLSTYKEV